MKFKVGDKVKFLNESGGGEITEIMDDQLVKVRDESGFEIPVLAKELINDAQIADYENTGEKTKIIEKRQETEKKKPKNIEKIKTELRQDVSRNASTSALLGFVPVDESTIHLSDIGMYLINDSDYTLLYRIGFLENTHWKHLTYGVLEDNTKLLIKKYNQSDVSKIKQVHIQLIFVSKGIYYPHEPVNKFIDTENIRFYKENSFKENDFFNEKALLFQMTDDSLTDQLKDISNEEISKALSEKEDIEREHSGESRKKQYAEEVDLHIEELTDNYQHLSAGEILNIQMSHFHDSMERAKKNKIQKIVFIHGVGNGTLKYEIIRTLKEKYPDLQYQDASFKEYGYGATMVFIR